MVLVFDPFPVVVRNILTINGRLWCWIFSKLVDVIICFNVFIGVFIRYYLMYEYESLILSAITIVLTVIILLLLLTVKFCLWKLTKIIQVLCQTIDSVDLLNQQSRATRHPSQLNGNYHRVRHILCRRTPPPPELNLPLIRFGVIIFLWIWARSPSREQWYQGLNELEVRFLKILQVWLKMKRVQEWMIEKKRLFQKMNEYVNL